MHEQPESIKSGLCENNPYCYYKQLKRLEQENRELKIYIESNKQQVEEVEMLVMDNDRLQQENRRLRKANEISIEKVTVTAEAKRLQELEQENKSNKELLIIAQNEAMEAQFDREKYKNALEEIRILATKDVSIESFVKIQNRINEVLNEN